jgi:putative PIN family toxin of toxin-antitoxin system
LRIVLDTNVLVRALLTPPNASRTLLNEALEGRGAGLTVLYDGRLLAEYRGVLLRPRFAFDEKRVLRIVRRLQFVGERVKVTRRPTLPRLVDPDDAPFMEVALVGRAAAIVTVG